MDSSSLSKMLDGLAVGSGQQAITDDDKKHNLTLDDNNHRKGVDGTGNKKPPADPQRARLRILCFHGYHGSASILRDQLDSLPLELERYADFILIDAPSLAHGDFGWWHARSYHNSSSVTYIGWDRTQAGLVQVFEQQGPFDGILGFSQGAILAGLLCGLKEYNHRHSLRPSPFQFNFAIMIGGFKVRDSALMKICIPNDADTFKIPSLHVFGRSDYIVSPQASADLSGLFDDPDTIIHDGSHVIPTSERALKLWTRFIKNQYKSKAELSLATHSNSISQDDRTAHSNMKSQDDRTAHSQTESQHGMLDHHPKAASHARLIAKHGYAPFSLNLWPTESEPRVHVTFPTADAKQHHPSAQEAALIIFRGGAYATSRGSGADAVQWAASKGFVAVQVDYGTASSRRYWPDNVDDGFRAVRLVRSMATELGIRSDRIAVLGFSAGAHLVATLAVHPNVRQPDRDELATRFSARPDLVVLAYGVLSFVDGYRKGAYLSTVDNFFGRPIDTETRKLNSPELQVKTNCPPVFVWTVRHDSIVPYTHSTLFADACKKAGVPVKLEVYEQGHHGIGMALRSGYDCERWSSSCLEWMGKSWK